MGLIVGTAVDHGTVGRRHLDHGTVVVLAEGVGGKIHRARRFRRVSQIAGVRLPGKVHSRLFRKSKHILIFVKDVFSLFADDLHQHIVAGYHEGLRHRQIAVASHPVYTFDVGAGHILTAVAEKRLVSGNDTLLQSRRDGKDLRWGTGLIGIAHTEISPLLIPGIHLFLVAHGGDLRVRVHSGEIPGVV